MSETGFKCPKCGQTAEFFTNRVLLYTNMRITKNGWDYMWDKYAECELPDYTEMTCGECQHTGNYIDFICNEEV